MPDARQPGSPTPEDWGQAFAALPLETPPAGGWSRVATALPARRSRARVWIPAAAAACLALAVAVPWRDTSPDPSSATTVARTPADTSPAGAPATPVVSPAPSPVPTTAIASNGEDAPPPAPLADTVPRDTTLATTDPQRGSVPPKATERRRASSARARDGQTADSALANAGNRAPAPKAGDTATSGSPAALETLYAESARLEALLSQIRDDRVASGPAMALSAALNERMAGIDVALSQPELSADTRVDLWRERVAVLQRLTGVEGTQRWMAANGYRADGTVAQVY